MKSLSTLIGLSLLFYVKLADSSTINDERLFFFFKNNFAVECQQEMHMMTTRIINSTDSIHELKEFASALIEDAYLEQTNINQQKIFQIQNPQIYYKSILSDEDILENVISNIRIYISGSSYKQLDKKEVTNNSEKQYFKAVINVKWHKNKTPLITINNMNNNVFPSDNMRLKKTKQLCI